jgi:hypothetical protein
MDENRQAVAPAATIVLWLVGLMSLGLATVATLYGFSIRCDEGSVNCSVNALLIESTGLLGMFLSSLIIVGGFALKTKHREKMQDERLRALEEEWQHRKNQ